MYDEDDAIQRSGDRPLRGVAGRPPFGTSAGTGLDHPDLALGWHPMVRLVLHRLLQRGHVTDQVEGLLLSATARTDPPH